jgi:iron complex outermembrane receptor protein
MCRWRNLRPELSIASVQTRRLAQWASSSALVAALLLIAVLLSSGVAHAAAPSERRVNFSIPAQRADRALTAFAEQADVTLVFPYDLASRSTAGPLVGTYGVAEGLAQLLDGTGLRSVAESGVLKVVRRTDTIGEATSVTKNRSLVGALGALLSFMSGASHAQAGGEAATLEEVTVTARKVEENLMTVPLAITALTSQELAAANVKSLSDIMQMTPGFHFESQYAGSRNDRTFSSLTFRGLFLSQNQGTSAGGQLFIDGAPVIGAQPPSIVDVERVEVLKGPQSAYFGRSTFVGAINFVTREPGNEFKTKLNLEFSQRESRDVSASIEGPLVEDKLAARISVRNWERGGYIANAAAPGDTELGKQSTNSFSASVVWTPTESFKAKTFLNFFRDKDGPPAQGAIKPQEFNGRVAASGACVPFSQAPAGTAGVGQAAGSRASFGYWCGELPDTDALAPQVFSGSFDVTPPAIRKALFEPNPLWTIYSPTFQDRAGLRRDALQGDVRLEWTFGGGHTLSSLTAYHSDRTMTVVDSLFRANTLVNPNVVALLAVQLEQRDWSQELRLTSPQDQQFRWTVGVNYLDIFTPGNPVWGLLPFGAGFSSVITEGRIETPAVFAAAYYDLTPALTLSLESRLQRDKITQTPKVNDRGLPVSGPAAAELSSTFKSFSPRVSLDWKYATDSVAYVLYSRGYRPGGFNAFLATATPATVAALQAVVPNAGLTYDEEQLDNVEVGVKSTWLGGRARTTLTLYKDKWKSGQVTNSIPVTVGNNLTAFPVVVNNGTADLKGVEFEAGLQVSRGLRLSGTFAINDSEVRAYGIGPGNVAGNCTDCNNIYGSYAGVLGRQLPGAPRVTGSLAAEFTAPITAAVEWFTRADLLHQGKRYTDFAGATWIGASNKVNARIGFRSDEWSFEAFGTNLTNDQTMQSAYLGLDFFSAFGTPATSKNEVRFAPAFPRTFGVRATYEF